MNVRRLALIATLAFAPAVALVPASHAAVPTCNGLEATIVGTDAQDKLVGTDGADVVVLGGGSDLFDGWGGDDVICGGDGNDRIRAGGGDDTIFGEAGDDTVHEAAGIDHLDGGTGRNRITYVDSDAFGLRFDARIGKATNTNSTDYFKNFTDVTGTAESDTLIGSQAANSINGVRGEKDVIYGFGGNDNLGSSSDQVFVDAGDGDDRVGTRSGKATVLLGAGRDRYFYSAKGGTGSRFVGGSGLDTIILWTVSPLYGYEVNFNQGHMFWRLHPGTRFALGGFENVGGSAGPDRIVGNALPNHLEGRNGDDQVLGLGGNDYLDGGSGSWDVAHGGSGADTCSDFDYRTSC